jgi:hypothetical protein
VTLLFFSSVPSSFSFSFAGRMERGDEDVRGS